VNYVNCLTRKAVLLLISSMICCTVAAVELTPRQVEAIELARTAGLAAQKAAIASLKAAEDAVAADDSAFRQNAVQRALDAAKDANEAATKAQLAVASLQALRGVPVTASPEAISTASTAVSNPAKPTMSIANAEVTGTLKAGQVDDTASIALSWASQTVAKSIITSVTLSAPISSSGNSTRLGTLDGLADTANIKLAQVRYFPVDPLHPDEKFWSIGVAGKVGKKEYSFINPSTFAEEKSSKTSISAAFFAGYVPNDKLMLLAKVDVQKKYTENDEGVLCRNIVVSQIACVSGHAGEPTKSTAKIFAIGARYLGSGFSIYPTFNYEKDAGIRGIDFPVYLIGAGDGKPGRLSGGVGASWRSDTNNTAFYVFVGSPFSFWAAQ
jgi:hypothetical protein